MRRRLLGWGRIGLCGISFAGGVGGALLTDCAFESGYLGQAIVPSKVDSGLVAFFHRVVFCTVSLAFCACGRRGGGSRPWGCFGYGAW